jgi:hypothetical protein
LIGAWRVVPGLSGGVMLYDLMGQVHGTLTGMTTAVTTGWNGTARPGGDGELRFNNTAATVALGAPASLNLTGVMSLFVWAKPHLLVFGGGGGDPLVSYGESASPDEPYGLLIGRADNAVSVRWNDTDVLVSSASIPTIDRWYHVGFTRSGSSGSWPTVVYANGVSIGSATVTTNPAGVAGAGVLNFGKRGAAGAFLDGALDEILIYNRALSAQEAYTLYVLSAQGLPGLLNRVLPLAVAGSGVVPMPRKPVQWNWLLDSFWRYAYVPD